MTDCPRIGKLFGGCKFSPRYDASHATREELDFVSDEMLAPDAAVRMVLAIQPKTYVADVCQTCGRVVRRDAALSQPQEQR